MTAGSWNAQRLEHKPRQQLPADRGSLDRGLLPMAQTTHPSLQPQPNRTFDNINPPPPLLQARLPNATLPDSTEIQHSPQLKKRGVAKQEVSRVGRSGGRQASVWLGPWRAAQIWLKCDAISAEFA